jgi:outer membrane protein TolC
MPSVDLTGQYVRMVEKAPTYFPDVILYPLAKIMDTSLRLPRPTGKLVAMASMLPDYNASASLNVKQILFNGAVIVGVGAANVYSHLARDLYYGKQVETVTKVRKAYYGALLAHEAVKLMRSSLKNAEENLKNVQLMRSQGIISEYDELRATVGVDNLRPAVIQSETNYSLALDALRNTIGDGTKEEIILSDSLTMQVVDESVISAAEEQVLVSNPGMNAVERQIDLNRAMVFAERSSYLPTLAAFGSYSYSGITDQVGNFALKDFNKNITVGLSLSLSLFQGLQTYSKVEQAQLEQRKTEEQKTSLERNLRMGVRSAAGNLKQAKKRVEAQEKTVETAERGYKIVTTRFLANAATQLEVNDAQLALNQAKVNRMQAIFDYLVASADLDQLLGRLPTYITETEE